MEGGAPYTDVRVEVPNVTLHDLRSIPGLVRVDLHPPAAGPEVELTFATAPGVEPTKMTFIMAEVERLLQRPVLACRRRPEGMEVEDEDAFGWSPAAWAAAIAVALVLGILTGAVIH